MVGTLDKDVQQEDLQGCLDVVHENSQALLEMWKLKEEWKSEKRRLQDKSMFWKDYAQKGGRGRNLGGKKKIRPSSGVKDMLERS